MQCPNCGRQNMPTSKFCVGCGTPLSKAVESKAAFCSECGTSLPTEAAFCVRCGTRVAAPSAPADDAVRTPAPAADTEPETPEIAPPTPRTAPPDAATAPPAPETAPPAEATAPPAPETAPPAEATAPPASSAPDTAQAAIAAAAMAPTPTAPAGSTPQATADSSPGGTAAKAQSAGRLLVEGLGKAERDPTGILAGVAIFVASALASWLLWYPLSWPSRWLIGLIPAVDCTTMAPASLSMAACIRIPATLSVVVTLSLIAILYRLRHRIMSMVNRLSARLPREVRFLTAPLMIALGFAFLWSGMHWAFPGQRGLLPQNLFPAAVGLLAYVAARYGSAMKRRLDRLFAWRDGLKLWQRIALVLVSPVVVSLLIPARSFMARPALGEQVAWLCLICAGYLVTTPRNSKTPVEEINRA